MGRRKPLTVQRWSQRAAIATTTDDAGSGSGSSGSGGSSNSRDASSANGNEDEDGVAFEDEDDDTDGDAADNRASKRRRTASPPFAPLGDCVPLTFRAAWTPERRADALWLRWTLLPSDDAALAVALQQLHGDAGRTTGSTEVEGGDAVVGLEVSGASGLVTLRADDTDDGAAVATSMTLGAFFPGASSEWQAQLLTLIADELMLLEIVQRVTACELRAGVAWRAYSELPRKAEFPRAHHTRSSQLKMQQVMLWLLAKARAADSAQCAYAYWREIDALFSSSFAADEAADEVFDIHDLYARIDVQRQLRRDSSNVDDASARSGAQETLLPSLRPYQKAAVSWMLARETRERLPRAEVSTLVRFPRREVSYDPFRARFVEASDEREDPWSAASSDVSDVRGGILADEMGLGKTVEVIALVLSHPWGESAPSLLSHHEPPQRSESRGSGCICGSDADEARGWTECAFCMRRHHRLCTGRYAEHGDADPFICFHCQPVQKPMLSSKVTLIVAPEAIVDQWAAELQRHVKPGTLKVLQYPGVRALRRSLEGLKKPAAEWQVLANAGLHLAAYDIVLTTYDVLSADLRYVPSDAAHERRASTRQKTKAYVFVSSPLVYLRFWRVVMDEAQLGIENTQLTAALTVAKLSAEMKWVVTGTPFSTQLGDLFGCLKFLGLAPFDDDGVGAAAFDNTVKHTFRRGASARLLDLLLWDGRSDGRDRHTGGGLLWRTGKRDVRQQLGLLEQQTEVVWCRFSEVERHYYDEEEQAIVKQVREYQRRHSSEAAGVTDAIWQELLGLRQICCHPQIRSARSGTALSLRGASRGSSTGVLSMDAFLKELVVKCRRECEEAQRKFVAALNALASIHLIKHERPPAVLQYLIATRVIRANWGFFRADLLPRLHILENLARCARAVFGIRADGAAGADTVSLVRRELLAGENAVSDSVNNPKLHALLPELPALTRTVTPDASEEAMREHADIDAIARECEALDACAHTIKRFYLVQMEASHQSALNAFEAIAARVTVEVMRRPSKRAVLCDSSLWWLSALDALERSDPELAASFADRLHLRLLAFSTPWAVRFCNQFATIAGFRLTFLNELEELATKRAALYVKLQQLSSAPPTKRDVELSGNCKECRDGRDGPTCAHCKLYTELEAFKRHFQGFDTNAPKKLEKLFADKPTDGVDVDTTTDDNITTDANADDDVVTSVSAAPSLILEIFREIASVTRFTAGTSGDPNAPTPPDGLRAEVEFWHQVQREWNAARKLFQMQHQRLGGLDELEMATMQIRLRLDGEQVKAKAEKEYKILPGEVPERLMKFESERVVSELEMHQKMARLRFLTHLGEHQQRQQSPASVAHTPTAGVTSKSMCAVCLETMANERVMLPCAHVFCKTCIQKLMKQHASSGSVRCPTCRVSSRAASVAVVFEDAESANARFAATKRGSQSTRPVADMHIQLRRRGYGSKMDAVARRVLALAQENAHVKCLLFTQWQDMMSIVADHLRANGIACLMYETKKRLPKVVQEFKQCLEPCVLALPFKVGANGLNLTEATEVLLVEPLLNSSIEAQAINRVHRIGQTKQTRVHRFVVDNSVEERIYWIGQKKRTKRQDGAAAVSAGGSEAALGADAGEDKENASSNNNNNADDTVERAPSKKEKEQLSLSELHVLLDGKLSGSREQRVGSGSDDDVVEETESELHPFWQERVVLDGRDVERLDAKLVLERREAAERRERVQPTDEQQHRRQEAPLPPPLTHLFDLELNVVVANEVVTLAYTSTLEQTHAISSELLAFHRARVQDELGVWQAMA